MNPSQRKIFSRLKNEPGEFTRKISEIYTASTVFCLVKLAIVLVSLPDTPDGYPRPQRIRDGLEEIEGVSKPQQLQNFPANGRRNWLEHHFAKYHSCIFSTGGFFWIHYACCGRAHRIGKKGISVSRFAQPAWLIFIGPPVFQVSKGLHPILLGKIWPSVYDDKRCSYNDEKWVDAMKNGMWDKLIEPQFAGSWRKVSWYLRRLRHGCTTQRYPGGRVVTHQLWNGKNSSWLPFRNSTLENRLLPCMLETCI